MRSLALLLALTGACTYQVNRAATVPHIEPMLRSGAPMDAPAELQLGAGSLAHITPPHASDNTAAVEIPGLQLDAQGRVRLGKYVGVGLVVSEGIAATAKAAKSTQVPVENGDPRGGGVQFIASIPTRDPHWFVGLGMELMSWSVPYVEYAVCTDCIVPVQTMEKGRGSVGQLGLGVTPTYRTDQVDVYGGLTVRNHPTIAQKGIELGIPIGDDVEEGPLNVVASLGVDVRLGNGLRAGAILYTPIGGSPVRYGPSLAATVTVPLGQ